MESTAKPNTAPEGLGEILPAEIELAHALASAKNWSYLTALAVIESGVVFVLKPAQRLRVCDVLKD